MRGRAALARLDAWEYVFARRAVLLSRRRAEPTLSDARAGADAPRRGHCDLLRILDGDARQPRVEYARLGLFRRADEFNGADLRAVYAALVPAERHCRFLRGRLAAPPLS